MHPIYDVDALLLLALSLSAKRRAAELFEVMAAIDLLHGSIPSEAKLADCFRRMSEHGLVRAKEGGFELTEAAQGICTGLPKKADTDERIYLVRGKLAVYYRSEEHPAIELSVEELSAAIAIHQEAAKSKAKNMLIPKPKPVEEERPRPGHWRGPGAGQRRARRS
jgi:hypothetical protein